MKVTVDTNVLIRSIVRDDKKQAIAADRVLRSAELIAVPLPCLCEFVWVLLQVYGIPRKDIAEAIRTLLGVGNVETDRAAVEAGLTVLEAGGDFADGIIAFEGIRLGGQAFVSFDRKAVKLLQTAGLAARMA
ncbi:MAG TPA: type II toxin-antitoxin system VapC family toxin [Solimonas sp.]|nr:type II toxin-antitoxin system VapC family toxin [Solimonas sp.]